MKKFLYVLLTLFQLSVVGEEICQSLEDLRSELFQMVKKEQNLRLQWINIDDSDSEERLREEVKQIDAFHLIKLKEVVKDYGWPGYSLIGPEGSHAFWLLVQHTPDQSFQEHCLELLEQAVMNQEASPIDLAYLKDRVCIHLGKKQIYGTQLNDNFTFYPIEDEEFVNERRAAIGLPTIEEYLEFIKEIYKTKRL